MKCFVISPNSKIGKKLGENGLVDPGWHKKHKLITSKSSFSYGVGEFCST